ncbi:MAG: DUF4129 domain-containing protein [Halobaculum sp.]
MVERRTALTALLALAAVLALGVSAATLTETTSDSPSDGFGAGGSDEQTGVGGDQQSGIDIGGESSQATQLGLGLCVRFFRSPEFLVGLGLVALVVFGLLYRTTRSWLLSGMAMFSLSLPVAMVLLLLTACQQGPVELAIGAGQSVANQSSLVASQGGGSPGAGGEDSNLTTPSSLLGIVLLLAVVGSVGLLLFSTGDDEDELADEPPEVPESARQRGVAEAAAVAADRLEGDAALENAVYRAWREMTTHLEVEEPRSSTPAEFAAAAVEAGMDREDVTELTELFESVRYGGRDPTPEEERRAIRALRNIEETYGEEFDTPEPRGEES